MKRVKINPPYISLTQQRLCCVPCAIQWILLRRGLPLFEQETIGKALGLTVPKKFTRLFMGKVRTRKKKPLRGWGTQAKTEAAINAFFKKHRIPLRATRIPYSKIPSPAELIAENLKKGNDVICITHMSAIDPKKKFGHALLATEIILGKNPTVIVGDPSFKEKKFYAVPLKKIMRGMTKEVGGVEREMYIFEGK